MRKPCVADVVIYGVIVGASVAVSIANLAGSLRVLDVSGSATYLSISVTLYNVAFTLMSWSWTRIFYGRLSRRGMIVVALSGLSVGLATMAFGTNLPVVLAGNTLVGLFSALVSPVLTTLLTDYLGKDSVAVTKYNTYSSIGLSLGYLIGGILRVATPTHVILALISALTATLIPLTGLIPQKYVIVEPRRVAYVSLIPQFTGRLRPLPSILLSPRIMYNFKRLLYDFNKMLRRNLVRRMPLTLVATGLFFAAVSVFFTPTPALMRELGLKDEELYYIYMVSTITSVFSYRFAHRFIQKPPKAWRSLIISTASRIIIFSTPIPLIVFSPTREAALAISMLIYGLIGFTWSFISSSLPVVILAMSESERRDERLGHMNAAIGTGTILGSLLSGVTMNFAGYIGTSILASALAAASVTVYFRAWKALVT